MKNCIAVIVMVACAIALAMCSCNPYPIQQILTAEGPSVYVGTPIIETSPYVTPTYQELRAEDRLYDGLEADFQRQIDRNNFIMEHYNEIDTTH